MATVNQCENVVSFEKFIVILKNGKRIQKKKRKVAFEMVLPNVFDLLCMDGGTFVKIKYVFF